jgi:hypothetical protein
MTFLVLRPRKIAEVKRIHTARCLTDVIQFIMHSRANEVNVGSHMSPDSTTKHSIAIVVYTCRPKPTTTVRLRYAVVNDELLDWCISHVVITLTWVGEHNRPITTHAKKVRGYTLPGIPAGGQEGPSVGYFSLGLSRLPGQTPEWVSGQPWVYETRPSRPG